MRQQMLYAYALHDDGYIVSNTNFQGELSVSTRLDFAAVLVIVYSECFNILLTREECETRIVHASCFEESYPPSIKLFSPQTPPDDLNTPPCPTIP